MGIFVRTSKLLFIVAFFSTCSETEPSTGKLKIQFAHHADNSPVIFNEMNYSDAAGNNFEVKELQYFISDITLGTGQAGLLLSRNDPAHYVDTNLTETLNWEVDDEIPAGTFQSISFTFGLSDVNNIPGKYVNPPESNMMWPYSIGGDNGGFHYLKFNGFWKNESQDRTPFNVHLGVGQTYNDEREVTGFIQNYFTVTIPTNLTITKNQTRSITLIMDINSWFDSPQVYNHKNFGSMIMTNQDAMSILCNNGKDAFSVSVE